MSAPEPPSSVGTAPPSTEIQGAAQLLADGHAAEAVERLKRLTETVPAYATAHVLHAKSLEALNRWEEALEAWHHAHFLAPTSPLVQRERKKLLDARASAIGFAPLGELDGRIPPEQAQADDTESSNKTAPIGTTEPEPRQNQTEKIRGDRNGDIDHGGLSTSEPSALNKPEPVDTEQSLTSSDGFDEPMVAEPDFEEESGNPLAGAREGEASWWRRANDRQKETEEDESSDGWTVVEESEASDRTDPLVEPTIAPPKGYNGPSEPDEVDDEIVEANVISEDAETDADDLDTLINNLEGASRIRPDPNFDAAEEELPADNRADEVVSETLARIYAAQGEYLEAARVYERLAAENPDRANQLRGLAADMRTKSKEDT